MRPFDNVGVQYGLAALNVGSISTTQFLDLNDRISGYDEDANYVSGRTSADPGAVRRTYQSGLSLSGGGGLASIPVFDFGGYDLFGRLSRPVVSFRVARKAASRQWERRQSRDVARICCAKG